MKKTNFAAIVAAIAVVMVMCVTSASAQIVRTGKRSLSHVPTTEQKKEIEKAEDVKLDELHGSRNWYAALAYAYGLNGGESYAGAEAGRRFGDHFRLGIQGMWCVTKDIVQHHSWVALKPSFDLISSESNFYKKTGLDLSISGFIGAMSQAGGKEKFPDDNGQPQLRDIPCRPYLTYGASAGISWNVARHFQVRAEFIYLQLTEEKKFADNIDAFCNGLSETDCTYVKSGNWLKNQQMVNISIAYHF